MQNFRRSTTAAHAARRKNTATSEATRLQGRSCILFLALLCARLPTSDAVSAEPRFDDSKNNFDSRAVHAGLNAAPKERSPGVYGHDFEHVAQDGTRTSLSYSARRSESVYHLNEAASSAVAVVCKAGAVVEITMSDPDAALAWTAGDEAKNATILAGDESFGCLNADGQPAPILHRVTQSPVLISEREVQEGAIKGGKPQVVWVFSLVAKSASFLDAFEHLHMRFYQGKQDVASARDALSKAVHRSSLENEKQAAQSSTQGAEKTETHDDDDVDEDASSSSASTPQISSSSSDYKIRGSGSTGLAGDSLHSSSPSSPSSSPQSAGSSGEESGSISAQAGKMPQMEFLTLLHHGNETAARESAGGRKLLFSCNPSSCRSGTYKYDTNYDGSTCCSQFLGTCNGWLHGSSRSYDCRSCSWPCATCSGGGTNACKSCVAGKYFDDGVFYDTCEDCTRDSHCSTGYRCKSYDCQRCSADKACATCESCSLTCSDKCTSCVSGSSRPHLYRGVTVSTCEQCTQNSHCDVGYDCDTGLLGSASRYTCIPGKGITCQNNMPARSTRTSAGSSQVVRVKSITVKQHAVENMFAGDPDYYFWSKTSSGEVMRKELPCLAHTATNRLLTVGAEVALVMCGTSFRFGIWEDDSPLGGFAEWLFDDAMGDRWFSTLDFMGSSTVTYDSAKIRFELECEGCHNSCTKENSMPARLFTSNPTWEFNAPQSIFPVGLWNYDSSARGASQPYQLTGGGLTFNCKNCHLTATDADVYVDIAMDANAGYKDISVWGDVNLLLHLNVLLKADSGASQDEQEWIKPLVETTRVPGLMYGIVVSGIGFQMGLKAGVDLVKNLQVTATGSAEYTSKVKGTSEFGFVYNMDSGIKFLSNTNVANEMVDFKNSVNAKVVATLALRPCLQLGAWAGVGIAEGHAYAEACAYLFANASVTHQASGFSSAQTLPASFDQAWVKLDKILPPSSTSNGGGFIACSSSKHDTRVLLDVGIKNAQLSTTWYAAAGWPGLDLKAFVWEEQFGPWRIEALEKSYPAASGCICMDDCSSGTIANSAASSGSNSQAAPPTTTDVLMPTSGHFTNAVVSLVGMRVYQWNSDSELAFRKAVASSAQVIVNHVRVNSVKERSLTSTARRHLLQSSDSSSSASPTLDVDFSVYAASEAAAAIVATNIERDITQGDLLVRARVYGLDQPTSVAVVEKPATTVVIEEESSDGLGVALYVGIAVGTVLTLLLFVGACCWYRRRNNINKKQAEAGQQQQQQQQPQQQQQQQQQPETMVPVTLTPQGAVPVPPVTGTPVFIATVQGH